MNQLSVVVPAYKAENWIGRTLQSISDQSVPAEILVVEDGVFDNTQSVVAEFDNIQLITLGENQGVGHARNAGLMQASGELVLFLDSDDLVEGEFLAGALAAYQKTRPNMVLAPWRFDGKPIDVGIIYKAPTTDILGALCAWLEGDKSMWSWPGRIFWDRRFLQKINGWNEQIPKREDDEMLVRGLLQADSLGVSETGTGIYWLHDSDIRRSVYKSDLNSYCVGTILDMIDGYLPHYDAARRQRLRLALGRRSYDRAYEDYCHYANDRGEYWVKRARDYGLSGHLGSRPHRVVSSILGLGRKFRLSRALHRVVDPVVYGVRSKPIER